MPLSSLQAQNIDQLLDITAASKGDHQAFARLVDAARSSVCSIALAIVRDVTHSEEVAQDVLVAAWRGLPRLRDPNSFWPWLRQLTRNRAHQHLRQHARWFRRHRVDHADQLLATAVDPGASAEASLLDVEEQAALTSALEHLPDEARELVVLYYREGQSVGQVAALLGISDDTAKKRLQRARDRVRADVLERLGELARRTAPGAAFTAAVLSAITVAAPSTAAAAGLGVGAKVLGGLKWAPFFAATVPALITGVFAVIVPMRRLVASAIDAQERRQLRWLTVFAVGAVAAFCVGMNLSLLRHDHLFMVAGFSVMQGSFVTIYGFLLPRVLRRRRQQEVALDPSAARRHRRQRWGSLIGLVAGGLGGGFAVWWQITHHRY